MPLTMAFHLENKLVRVELIAREYGMDEIYYARKNNEWVPVFHADGRGYYVGSVLLRGNFRGGRLADDLDPDQRAKQTHRWPVVFSSVERDTTKTGQVLVAQAQTGSKDLQIRYRLMDNSPVIHVTVEMEFSRKILFDEMTHLVHFCGKEPEFCFTPQLRPGKNDVIADHTLRTPLLFVQSGRVAGALIPDIDKIRENRNLKMAAEFNRKSDLGTALGFGYKNWHTHDRTYYRHSADDIAFFGPGKLTLSLFYHLDAEAPPNEGYRKPQEWIWRRWGRPNLAGSSKLQRRNFDKWERKTYDRYAQEAWFSIPLSRENVGGLRSLRNRWANGVGTNDDCWFSQRFQTLRTALGLYLYGVEHNNMAHKEKGESVLRLILNAPVDEGFFPTIFYLENNAHFWIRDDGWAGLRDYYHVFDMSWTAFWLLKWHDLTGLETKKIREFTIRYGNALLRHQRPNGCIPSWFLDGHQAYTERFFDFNAETGCSALFLADLFLKTKEKRFLVGARMAADFLIEHVIPHRKWSDYETFLAGSKKSFDFNDPYTGEPPQSILCMIQAAYALLWIYRITKQRKYIKNGRAVLEYLTLFQQIWTPSWMTPNLFGGFGVQNTDAEWSDARWCYCADLLFTYYMVTGKQVYFERAVAAMRSGFHIAPYSSWGPGAEDMPGANLGLNWGIGSAAATVTLWKRIFGDIHVRYDRKWAVGINNCTVTEFKNRKNDGFLKIQSENEIDRTLLVSVAGAKNIAKPQISINGKTVLGEPSEPYKIAFLPF